jgi:hypothetical protein
MFPAVGAPGPLQPPTVSATNTETRSSGLPWPRRLERRCWHSWRRAAISQLSEPARTQTGSSLPRWPLFAALFGGLLLLGILVAPSAERIAALSSSKIPPSQLMPMTVRLAYLVPAAGAMAWLLMMLVAGRRSLRLGDVADGQPTQRRGTVMLVAFSMLAVLWTCWVLDRFMVDISPHWSQKHVFATYYRLRKGPEEPVVAWMMYWRGENFYTCNQIYDHRIDAAEKTVFLGDKNVEKLQAYLTSHRGRRIFFLIERHRLESLRGNLPEASRSSLQVVDDSNNKVYLAVAQL